ncbi:MAG: hypothetical protein CVV47_14760 [Spirochaetae bacterium HGW-Spirochaetae-3]|jgi:PAS domain S-box-containing protein|nr:MAG: hypothetical protein CVV47_14760 [Spirochaetae bacterium HGW-Spirochaetae-3]
MSEGDRCREITEDDIEAELEIRTRMLKLTADLCSIYAKDISENANVSATNIIKRSFKADAAAIFYVSGTMQYHYCLAGTDFPIALTGERWRASVNDRAADDEVFRFGPWAPPGMDSSLPLWISYKLYTSNTEGGFIFLGRSKFDWSDEEQADLVAVVKAITPIIQVRFERLRDEAIRIEAEKRLAKNERRLRTFLEGSRDMIYTANAQDVITSVNAAGLTLLGYSSKSELVGKPFSTFVVDAVDRSLQRKKVRETGYAADYEISLKRADGSRIFCLETAYAIRNAAGNIVELQGIVKDITERIASESAMWKMNIELADANMELKKTHAVMVQHEKMASIGQLAAGVAHEINNPLGFLKSNHEMLESYIRTLGALYAEIRALVPDKLDEIANRYDLAYIQSEIDAIFSESDEGYARIMRIVENLKNFSRSDQGLKFERYDVNAGIESTLVVARNEIKYVADVQLKLGPLPRIMARGNEINQVFLNILVNAAQAIASQKRETRGVIAISTVARADSVLITIKDNGPGILPAIVNKVFDPFFTTKEPGKGTGLGLSISYDIITTKHGGVLSIDSTPGEGSVFSIVLPIEREPDHSPEMD